MTLFVVALIAASTPTRPAEVSELHYSLPVDIAVTSSLLTGWVLTETVWKDELAPSTCRWCSPSSFDTWGRQFRAPLEQQAAAASASDWLNFAVLPALTLGAHTYAAHDAEAMSHLPVDFLLIAEATSVTAATTQLVKFLVGRERPFVWALSGAEKDMAKSPEDNNLSFFSGHASFAFAMAVSTGTVANLRGYKSRALIWGIGLTLATSVAALRVVADKHYLTDVLVGAAVGSTLGWALPTYFHGRKNSTKVSLQLFMTGNGVGIAGVF